MCVCIADAAHKEDTLEFLIENVWFIYIVREGKIIVLYQFKFFLSCNGVKVKTLVSDWWVSGHVPIDLCACVCMCVPSFVISIWEDAGLSTSLVCIAWLLYFFLWQVRLESPSLLPSPFPMSSLQTSTHPSVCCLIHLGTVDSLESSQSSWITILRLSFLRSGENLKICCFKKLAPFDTSVIGIASFFLKS